MRAFPLSAYSPGEVIVDVLLDGFVSGALINLGNGYDLGLVVKRSGFLGNRLVYHFHAEYKQTKSYSQKRKKLSGHILSKNTNKAATDKVCVKNM